MTGDIEGGPTEEEMGLDKQKGQSQEQAEAPDVGEMSRQAIETAGGKDLDGFHIVETTIAAEADTDYDDRRATLGTKSPLEGKYAPGSELEQTDFDAAARAAVEVYQRELDGGKKWPAAANEAANKAREMMLNRRAELLSGESN